VKAANVERVLRDLGRRVAELRADNGLTQEGLAEQVDLAPRYLQAIESGRENPTARVLIEIAFNLHVSMSDLFRPPRSPGRSGRPPSARPTVEARLACPIPRLALRAE
jgi:transcriptional regulator with XRE-family HTH domain